MTFQNPLADIAPTTETHTFVASGRAREFEELGLDALKFLINRFPALGARLRGEEFDPDQVDEAEFKAMTASVIAMAIAPGAKDVDRAAVEASALGMRKMEREAAFMTIIRASFPGFDEAFEESEGTEGKPLATIKAPANRKTRRAVRSSGGKTKPQT